VFGGRALQCSLLAHDLRRIVIQSEAAFNFPPQQLRDAVRVPRLGYRKLVDGFERRHRAVQISDTLMQHAEPSLRLIGQQRDDGVGAEYGVARLCSP
jgi:hypothetical protein